MNLNRNNRNTASRYKYNSIDYSTAEKQDELR